MTKESYYIDRDFGTTSLRNPKNGQLKGRKRVKGPGDRTAIRRGRKSGHILGRTKKIKVKGSSTRRGYIRRSK